MNRNDILSRLTPELGNPLTVRLAQVGCKIAQKAAQFYDGVI